MKGKGIQVASKQYRDNYEKIFLKDKTEKQDFKVKLKILKQAKEK